MKIAVILPVYKNDKVSYLHLSFDSILNQTYKDIHLYIGVDGPVGEELEKCLKEFERKENVTISWFKENRGLAIVLNDLLDVCLKEGYEYIARMDADDISLPERFEKQLEYYKVHQEIECLGTWAIEITSNGEEYFRKQMPQIHEECLNLFRKRDPMIHPTVMFHRSYIEKAGMYALDTFFGEDTMMWAQGFAAGCKLGNVPEYLFKFRLDDNFFERRRGWKYAKGIWELRHRVNKMLGFGIVEECWALAYAAAKMMPKVILNIIYKTAR